MWLVVVLLRIKLGELLANLWGFCNLKEYSSRKVMVAHLFFPCKRTSNPTNILFIPQDTDVWKKKFLWNNSLFYWIIPLNDVFISPQKHLLNILLWCLVNTGTSQGGQATLRCQEDTHQVSKKYHFGKGEYQFILLTHPKKIHFIAANIKALHKPI